MGDRAVLTSSQIAEMLQDSMTWDGETMLAYQRLQLAQLLVHAKETCPFYKDRLAPVFASDGSVFWENWRQIPILSRQDLQRHGPAMESTAPLRRHGKIGTSTSSGSTGRPVTIKVPHFAIHIASFAWQRFYKLHDIGSDDAFTEFKAFLPNGKPMTKDILTFAKTDPPSNGVWINRNLSVESKLDYLESSGARLLADTPNHMEVLAHENLRRAKRILLQKVLGIGMKISPYQEALFGESFGATTLSPYSSKEGTLMAFQCAHERSNFHVCAELALVEILDEKGEPVPAGVPGRIIITPFFNSSQPLIRYDHGDIVVRGESCGCGMTLPVLSEIRGRSDAIFRFPGKNIAFTRIDDLLVQKTLSADAYQFAQVAPLHIVVRYVSMHEADTAAMDTIRNYLLDIVQTAITVSFARVQEIPFNPGGKQQRVTREFEPNY